MNEANLIRQILKSRNVDKIKELPWYIRNLEELDPEARDVFEKYSKVPSEDVISHVTQARDRAFEVFPYPCLGYWRFLEFSIGKSALYPEVLQRVKDGEQYLDIGCCFGQDIRKLVQDGAPSENTYGSDVQDGFFGIGYDLFLDKDTLKTTFIGADVFDADSALKQLDGKLNIVHAASFFHLFDLEAQIKAAKRLVALLKPEAGSLIFGKQMGNLNATVVEGGRFMHDGASWAKLWKRVGEETGSEWAVEAGLSEEKDSSTDKTGSAHLLKVPGTRRLTFAIRRV